MVARPSELLYPGSPEYEEEVARERGEDFQRDVGDLIERMRQGTDPWGARDSGPSITNPDADLKGELQEVGREIGDSLQQLGRQIGDQLDVVAPVEHRPLVSSND